MGYITRNANLILLFLILLAAVFIVGVTVYYEGSFEKINKQYSEKLAQLENVSKELQGRQDILNRIKEDLQLKVEREEEFTERYGEVKTVKEGLELDKKRLITEKNSLDSQLKDTIKKLNEKSTALLLKEQEAETLKADITALNKRIDSLKDDIGELKDEIDCLESTADASEGTC